MNEQDVSALVEEIIDAYAVPLAREVTESRARESIRALIKDSPAKVMAAVLVWRMEGKMGGLFHIVTCKTCQGKGWVQVPRTSPIYTMSSTTSTTSSTFGNQYGHQWSMEAMRCARCVGIGVLTIVHI